MRGKGQGAGLWNTVGASEPALTLSILGLRGMMPLAAARS